MNTFTKGTPLGILGAGLGAAMLLGALAAPAVAQFGGPPAPPNTGVPLYAKLTGGSGQGNATVVVDPPKGTACYLMNVGGLDGVTAAHIHAGGPGETGRVVVPFETPEDGRSGGCAHGGGHPAADPPPGHHRRDVLQPGHWRPGQGSPCA